MLCMEGIRHSLWPHCPHPQPLGAVPDFLSLCAKGLQEWAQCTRLDQLYQVTGIGLTLGEERLERSVLHVR